MNRRRPSPAVVACALAGAAAAAATAGAAPVTTIDDELAALRAVTTMPVHASLVGWTPEDRAVYRALVCDADDGGGRGPYCDLTECITAPPTRAGDGAECVVLVSLSEYEPAGSDAPSLAKARSALVAAQVRAASADHLAKLGKLAFGRSRAATSIATSVRSGVFSLARRGKSGIVTAVVAGFATTETEPTERPEALRDIALTAVSESPDGVCAAVLGHYVLHSHYEAVATATPFVFAKVLCDP